MKKQWIIGGAVLLVLVLLVWIVWPKGQSAHIRVIPADATALAEFDVAEFTGESDLTEEKIKKMLPEKVDLSNIGVDWEQNVYVFVDAAGMNGLVLAVKDVEQVKDFLNKNSETMKCTPIEEQQGFFWTLMENSFLVGFNDEVLLVMGPTIASAQDELRQQMVGYLKQDKGESVLEAPLYKNLQEQEGFLKLTASLEMFPEYYRMFKNLGLPEHVDFSKMHMIGAVNAEKGKIVLHTGLITEDKELAQKMKALDDLCGEIDGDLISTAPATTIAWMGTNLKGEKFMKLASEIPALRLYLMSMNQVMDIEKMINHIDGDMACAVSMNMTPVVRLQAQVSDLSFMDDVDYWISSSKKSGAYQFERLDEDLYRIGNGGRESIFMGLKDKNVLFTNDQAAMKDMQDGTESDLLKPYRKDIESSKFYMWTNLSTLMMFTQSMGVSNNPEVQKIENFLSKFSAVALRSTNATSMDLIIYMKDKNGGLKQLFE